MPANYSDTSGIADSQQIDAADVRPPIDALDDALKVVADNLATVTANVNAIIAAPVVTTSSTAAFSGESVFGTLLTSALTTPPAIGGTTPAAGTFTTLNASSSFSLTTTTTTALVTITANAGVDRDIRFNTTGGARWILRGANSTAESGGNAGSNFQLYALNDAGGVIGIALAITRSSLAASFGGALAVTGALSKGSGSFEIPHPLDPAKMMLVHSFIEGPKADLIYRGRVTLEKGRADIDLDAAFGMQAGTFAALTFFREADVFLQNRSGFSRLIGDVDALGFLRIQCEDASSDVVSWMVVAERADAVIKAWARTNAEGRLQTEWPMSDEERTRYAEAYARHQESDDPELQGVKEIYQSISREHPDVIAGIEARRVDIFALDEDPFKENVQNGTIANDRSGATGRLQEERG